MSKKKKGKSKRKNLYKMYDMRNNGGKKKKNKSSGSKAYSYKAPEYKQIKPSVTKKEAKEAKKIILEPVEVPKDFKKNRSRCNHAGTLITAAEFKDMTPTYAAFTPMLDAAVESYGEDNIRVCKSCYDVLVDPSKVSADGMRDSMLLMYLSINAIISRKRMRKEEIKELTKLRDSLSDWDHAVAVLRKLEDSGALCADDHGSTLSNSDLASLSRADRVNPM